MIGQTSKDDQPSRGSTDREMWSHDIAWLLTEADAALGCRSTTGAVIAVIEHGGVTGNSNSDAFHGVMIDRIDRGAPVDRYRRLAPRWHSLEHHRRRVHIAHYVGASLGRRFEYRLGELAGVVVQLWLDQCAVRRGLTAQRHRSAAADALELVYEELWETEARAPADSLEIWEARLSYFREGGAGFQAMSAAGIAYSAVATLRTIKRLRTQLDALLSAHATGPEASDLAADLDALDVVCKRGDPPGLRELATYQVRDAHRAWNASGPAGGEPRTKLERRMERAATFFRRVDT